MTPVPFRLVRHEAEPLTTPAVLDPGRGLGTGHATEAHHYLPGEELETAINTAIAVGDPLLITGDPGTGKTQAAYYTAWKLGLSPVIHFQVKSDSQAVDLLYRFDAVRYFSDAQVRQHGEPAPHKADYIDPGPLWQAMDSEHARVLLIDEIDKAPRDFPNDLLHELDQMTFTIKETGQEIRATEGAGRPIVLITSNSERRLPSPFLRRCVYHHIEFDDAMVKTVVQAWRADFPNLPEGLFELAIDRFLELRHRDLNEKPSLAELLVWLGVLDLADEETLAELRGELSRLPFRCALLKDRQDLAQP